MSVMFCSNCGCPVDTDFDDYYFDDDLCESCKEADIVQKVTKSKQVDDILERTEE